MTSVGVDLLQETEAANGKAREAPRDAPRPVNSPPDPPPPTAQTATEPAAPPAGCADPPQTQDTRQGTAQDAGQNIGQGTTHDKPRRKYTRSDKVRASSPVNLKQARKNYVFTPARRAAALKALEKANAAPPEKRNRLTERRLLARYANLALAHLKLGPPGQRSPSHLYTGLSCRHLEHSLALAGETRAALEAHRERFRRAFRPRDQEESRLVQGMADVAWRLLRAFAWRARWEMRAVQYRLMLAIAWRRAGAVIEPEAACSVGLRLLLDLGGLDLLWRERQKLAKRLEQLARALLSRRLGAASELRFFTAAGSRLPDFAHLPEFALGNPYLSAKEAAKLAEQEAAGPKDLKDVKDWEHWAQCAQQAQSGQSVQSNQSGQSVQSAETVADRQGQPEAKVAESQGDAVRQPNADAKVAESQSDPLRQPGQPGQRNGEEAPPSDAAAGIEELRRLLEGGEEEPEEKFIRHQMMRSLGFNDDLDEAGLARLLELAFGVAFGIDAGGLTAVGEPRNPNPESRVNEPATGESGAPKPESQVSEPTAGEPPSPRPAPGASAGGLARGLWTACGCCARGKRTRPVSWQRRWSGRAARKGSTPGSRSRRAATRPAPSGRRKRKTTARTGSGGRWRP